MLNEIGCARERSPIFLRFYFAKWVKNLAKRTKTHFFCIFLPKNLERNDFFCNFAPSNKINTLKFIDYESKTFYY